MTETTMENVSGFTPGPWRIVRYGDGNTLVIHDARDDWRVCFMATVAEDSNDAVIQANAHLVAAAPKLYEALSELLKHAAIADAHPEDVDGDDFARETFARRMLAKARGEA